MWQDVAIYLVVLLHTVDCRLKTKYQGIIKPLKESSTKMVEEPNWCKYKRTYQMKKCNPPFVFMSLYTKT